METFRLQSHLAEVYKAFPEAADKPLIGITGNHSDGNAALRDPYYEQVVRAGGVPVIIPPVADKDVIINILQRIDGLLLSGGADYNPLWAGEEPSLRLGGINAVRDLPELLAVRLAYNRQMPIFGICRGMQTIALAFGGHIVQDMASSPDSSQPASQLIKHSQDCSRTEPTHSVIVEQGTVLFQVYEQSFDDPSSDTPRMFVNSLHHQAVDNPGPLFNISAKAPDGTIEAIESLCHKSVIGVQWHPEWLEAEGLKLFQWLVAEASTFRKAKLLHKRIVTLDSHCDTPMFFNLNAGKSKTDIDVHFEQRDEHILVDLHKMADGMLDAVTMAAYLPQAFDKEEKPFDYANSIFDRIETIIKQNDAVLNLARTPADILRNKLDERRSIMLAIENGLALEHELKNVAHFARRGVVYITLCHNGDNDICDSARGNETHGGLSEFGREVIREMNSCGIMVDLSHAAEKSFYDALSASKAPIVCSHSNCRALCDHPRNLTDSQLKALARCGGVAQITLYAGFLRKEGEASVINALQHLQHAIDIMGTDHVGIGTDFDGDGGVAGFADASEALNFTMHLMRRRYSEDDIRKIWGGNWLRVMAEVQSKATKA